MNLKSYLEEHVVYYFFLFFILIICLMEKSNHMSYFYHIYAVCILAYNRRNHLWCCGGVFRHVHIPQNKENTLGLICKQCTKLHPYV